MERRIEQALKALAAQRTAWRRKRNFAASGRPLRQARRLGLRLPPAGSAHWIAAAGALAALGGAVVIASHAHQLARSAGLPADAAGSAAAIFQPVAPGAMFGVPDRPGVVLHNAAGGAFAIAAGMRAAPPVRIDLCGQAAGPSGSRLAPLRIGYHFGDIARLAQGDDGALRAAALRNVALAAPGHKDMPRLTVSGSVLAGQLQVRWESADGRTLRWLDDAGAGQVREAVRGTGGLRREAWLAWEPTGALRLQRRASSACPRAGELVVQVFRAGVGGGRAQVTAFPAAGDPVSAWLAPGDYRVPEAPAASLEDEALFEALRARGLVRLGPGGLAELAPPDLAAWQAAGSGARAGTLPGWRDVKLDDEALALLGRLYRMADGAFVREQVRIFNSERRLLAWRVRPVEAHGDWQASVGAAPASTTAAMPLAASRLFAELPQGWAPWTRVAAWPQGAAADAARLTLASPGAPFQLMLAGELLGVDGARMRSAPAAACTGRACPAAGAVQVLDLEPLEGARSITLHARPLAMAALANPADQHYRHLRAVQGRLAWHTPRAAGVPARSAALAPVRLTDRHGTLLWSAGAPTAAAIEAGLAPLLGMRADHASSVAGMLARLPAQAGAPHQARLSLDLPLQMAGQRILECIGMRRGSWDGARCQGGQPAPRGRQAGLVVLDTASGDVLAAAGAGAGAGEVTAANWDEVRNFDRTNPARSPLRLPAFQHDGGAHRSPGSTFKIITALGLEKAAQRDRQIDALLAGLPLAAINELAAYRGFAFQTGAPAYPMNTRRAHITNYRDQHLDRRAQDGRFGLPQALTYSLNTWFAWSGELADRSLFGRADGGVPALHALEPGALDTVRPVVGMARRLGFENAWRLDGGLLPAGFPWSDWDALQASAARIDPVQTRHELRQMAIGLRMQVTPLQMAVVAAGVGQGAVVPPRLLLSLDGRDAVDGAATALALGVRLDRVRAGMKGVVDGGTAASAFRNHPLLRAGMSGKTGTAPTVMGDAGLSTVWFTGWLEPGSIPGEKRRLAVAAFVSHSEGTGGEHAAPVVAAVLATLAPEGRQEGSTVRQRY